MAHFALQARNNGRLAHEQFRLDERLEKDTLEIGVTGICRLRLMNDARWPWLVLVPMMPGGGEMHDLPKKQQGSWRRR